jgi:hypothetical protein
MTVARSFNASVLSASCAASAGIHAGLVPAHLGESPSLGLAFLASALVLIAFALALSVGSAQLVQPLAPAAALLMAVLITAYGISRTVGLPFGGEGVEEWDVLGLVTQSIQVAGLAAAAALHKEVRI